VRPILKETPSKSPQSIFRLWPRGRHHCVWTKLDVRCGGEAVTLNKNAPWRCYRHRTRR